MFDHLGFDVSDFKRSKAFYDSALKPLGLAVQMGGEGWAGYGTAGKPGFWIAEGARKPTGVHVAFAADTRALVDAFYAAAIAGGGKDNGPPGLRAQYHPTYYGAFVLDPDGVNVEAVCHKPE